MRHTVSSWTNTLSKLGLRRRKRSRKRLYTRHARLEPLEARELLAVAAYDAESEPVSIVSEAAPADYRVGHFELTSENWTGRRGDYGLRRDGKGLGVDARDGGDPQRFDPGESWSFQFDKPGLLLGIHFDGFTIDDADRAVLVIGDREPIEIEAKRVAGGFWRPSELLKFEAAETLEIRAVAPTEADLEAAADQLATQGDPGVPTAPTSRWKVKGLQVLGRDDTTFGGYISLNATAQSEPPAALEETTGESVSQSTAYGSGTSGPSAGSKGSGITLTSGGTFNYPQVLPYA